MYTCTYNLATECTDTLYLRETEQGLRKVAFDDMDEKSEL